MPKVKDEMLLMPLSFQGHSLEEARKVLDEERERLIAQARSIAFFAIRSAMFFGKGNAPQSERTYLYMALAEEVETLSKKLERVPAEWTIDDVEVEYHSFEARAQRNWQNYGGIIGFLRPLTLTAEQSRVRALIESAALSHDELAREHPSGPDKIKAETLRRFAEVFL